MRTSWTIVLLLSVGSCHVAMAQDAAVPPIYRSLYAELDGYLRQAEEAVAEREHRSKQQPTFGVELLVANSNRGEELLTPRVTRGVSLTLDRLKQLGCGMVSVSIQFPVLTQRGGNVEKYRAFYRHVAREVRRRKMKLVVEIGTTFRQPEFSSLRVDYRGLTVEEFASGVVRMTKTIQADMKPDWLTILTEPKTCEDNTGLKLPARTFAAIVAKASAAVTDSAVAVGSGAGTWDDMAYFNALAGIGRLDYLDVHIYPIHPPMLLERFREVASLAKKAEKRIAVGEAWLYKVARSRLRGVSAVEVFARDVWSFWQPLDERFLRIVKALADRHDAAYCSFFWMQYLYAYLPYDETAATLSPGQLLQRAKHLAAPRIRDGKPNELGKVFRQLVGMPKSLPE